MANQPSVLILDDGELDNVYRMLLELRTDVVRLRGAEIGRSVVAPRDLLVTAGPRTLGEMPELTTPEGTESSPVWICVHNQDFMPLRDRLCEMGVHYLLQNALDEQSRRRFLIQLLRSGAEQRASLRLHLGGDVGYRTDKATWRGKLVELSVEGCRILAQEPIDLGTPLTTILPPSLGGGVELELKGIVLREAEPEVCSGQALYSTVIGFGELDDATRGKLESIARGERIGTKITPLASLPEEGRVAGGDPADGRPDEEGSKADADRRDEVRHAYDRPVHVIGYESAEGAPVLGCDLSLSGVRLSGCPGFEADVRITLAIYGSPREEPIVLEAVVVRSTADGEIGVAFDPLSPNHQQALEKLLDSYPVLDALHRADADAGRTIVANVRQAASR